MEKLQKRKIFITLMIMSIFALTCIFTVKFNLLLTEGLMKRNIVTKRNNLLVHFISVGQGDAVAINFPDDKIMLIDTGTVDSSVGYTNYLYEHVLNNSKDKNIDYLVLSHADADHIGGSLRLLENFKVNTVFLPILDSDNELYRDFKEYLKEKGIYTKVIQNEESISDKYKVKFYTIDSNETNASSTVVKIDYKETSFLFTGDIDHETEQKYIKTYGDELDSDVLKVAHHGSKYSTSREFLEVVTPVYSVVSCDKNSYGHPTDTVLKNLENAKSKVYRTDNDGNILIMVDGLLGLKVLTSNYYITNLWFNYVLIVMIIEIIIIISIAVRLIKIYKKKQENK